MTTLIDCADALAGRLRAALPDIPVISADPPPQGPRSLRVPAVYLDMDSIETMRPSGDARMLTDVRWQARCLVSANEARADWMVRALAVRVAQTLLDICRPLPGHGHIHMLTASDDAFRPEVDGYKVWVVEFAVEMALGELEPPGIPPSTVYLGLHPNIGEDHLDEYGRIA